MKITFSSLTFCALLLLSLVLSSAFSLRQSVSSESAGKGGGRKPAVTVLEGVLKVGKKTISGEWKFSEFREVLGNQYIVGDEGVLVHYPASGLTFYLDQSTDLLTAKVREIHLYFQQGMGEQEKPVLTHPFPGKVKVDKLTLSRSTTVADVKSLLADYTFEDAYFENTIYCAMHGIYFFFHAASEGGPISYISFGPDL
jgi:hypothetical protein